MASDDQVESPCDERSRAPSTLHRPIAAAATTAGKVTATKMLMSKRHPRTTHPIPAGRACEKASSRALSSPVGLVPDSLDADVDPDMVQNNGVNPQAAGTKKSGARALARERGHARFRQSSGP